MGEGQKSIREISRVLGRSAGTLSRELRRNRSPFQKKGYFPRTAHRMAEARLILSHWSPRLKNSALRQEIWHLLEKGWSPELVSGRLKRTRPDLPTISPEAIYQWVYADRRDLIRYLPRRHRKRGNRKSYRTQRPEHEVLNEDFGLTSYFCEPYHSWEKGTVENTNGLIRRFVPKRSDLATLTDPFIVKLENWLNDRPRKVLKFQTPREAFEALCVALAG